MGIEIRTEIIINKPYEVCWKELQDANNWSKWNNLMHMKCDGTPVAGGTTHLSVRAEESAKFFELDPKWTTVSDGEIRWGGAVGGCLLVASHWLVVSDAGDGKTKLEHNEDFTGPLPALNLGFPYGKLPTAYAKINEDFKAHCESL